MINNNSLASENDEGKQKQMQDFKCTFSTMTHCCHFITRNVYSFARHLVFYQNEK